MKNAKYKLVKRREGDKSKVFLYKRTSFLGIKYWKYIDYHYESCLDILLNKHIPQSTKVWKYLDEVGKEIHDL